MEERYSKTLSAIITRLTNIVNNAKRTAKDAPDALAVNMIQQSDIQFIIPYFDPKKIPKEIDQRDELADLFQRIKIVLQNYKMMSISQFYKQIEDKFAKLNDVFYREKTSELFYYDFCYNAISLVKKINKTPALVSFADYNLFLNSFRNIIKILETIPNTREIIKITTEKLQRLEKYNITIKDLQPHIKREIMEYAVFIVNHNFVSAKSMQELLEKAA